MEIKRDSLVEGEEFFTVKLSTEPEGAAGPITTQKVIIADANAAPDIVVRPEDRPLHTREQGSLQLEVRLATLPTASVTVFLESSDLTEGVPSPTSLTFTTGDWNVFKPVSLIGVDDELCDGTQTYSIVLRTASADAGYRALRRTVPAETADNEVACLLPSTTVCADADNTVVYTIEIANAGPQPVAAHLEDTLPPAVSVVTASADSGVATVDYLENSVVWNGLVPVGRNVVITIVAGLDALPPGTEVSNTATLSWVRDDQGTVATLASPAVFRSGDLGCPPTTPP